MLISAASLAARVHGVTGIARSLDFDLGTISAHHGYKLADT